MRRLGIGEWVVVDVDSMEHWNAAGLVVTPGERYNLTVDPPDQKWTDLRICATAEGYKSCSDMLRRAEPLRRVPGANWFRLIGVIGQDDDTAFSVGTSLAGWSPALEGPLYFFANDVWLMYWNNEGRITVRVTRVS